VLDFGVRVVHDVVDANNCYMLASLVHVKSSSMQPSYVSTARSSAKSVALGYDLDRSGVDVKSPSAEYTAKKTYLYTCISIDYLRHLHIAPPPNHSVLIVSSFASARRIY
jgi:hypothetical protein